MWRFMAPSLDHQFKGLDWVDEPETTVQPKRSFTARGRNDPIVVSGEPETILRHGRITVDVRSDEDWKDLLHFVKGHVVTDITGPSGDSVQVRIQDAPQRITAPGPGGDPITVAVTYPWTAA